MSATVYESEIALVKFSIKFYLKYAEFNLTSRNECLSILHLIHLFFTNFLVGTDLCCRMSCLYPRVSWLSVWLNVEISVGDISGGFREFLRDRIALSWEREREKATRNSELRENKSAGRRRRRRRRRASSRENDTEIRSARKRSTGSPNNSQRATRDVYVSRRRDARVRLAAVETARRELAGLSLFRKRIK